MIKLKSNCSVQVPLYRLGVTMLAAWWLAAATPLAQAQGNPLPSAGPWQPGAQAAGPAEPPHPAKPPTEVVPITPSTPPQPAPPTPPAAGPAPTEAPSILKHATLAAPTGPPDAKDPRSWLWEYQLAGFTDKDYQTAVNGLVADFEKRLGKKLVPGTKRRVGLKVMTSVAGLTTPPGLVRAMINVLEARGFKRSEMFILDQSESRLRDAGFLPPRGKDADEVFEGVPVIVMERGKNYDAKWNYDSPLPAPDSLVQASVRELNGWKVPTTDRLSLLPVPLMLGVDFWINLPVGVEQPSLGLMGALANGSVLASSNTERFMQSPETGAVAVAEIAAIPELTRGWMFSILSLEHYQYIGGPRFNSLYTESEPTLLLSANPVVLDYLLFTRMNGQRVNNNLPAMDQPTFLEYARQLDLGDFQRNRIYLVRMPK